MKKTIFSLATFLGLMGFVAQAEEAFADNQTADFVLNNFGDKMEAVSTVTTIAEIDIRNLVISQNQNATNSFKISFDVQNGGKEAQGGLVYGAELIKRNETNQQEIVFLDAQYFSDASFSIAGGELLKKEFEYAASDFLTGEAELWVNLKNASGMEMSSGVEKVQLNGSGQYLELGNPCFFTVGAEQKKYNLATGVDVEKKEQLFLNCQATNKASQNLDFDLEQTIYERSLAGEKKSSIAGDKLSFSSGESRLLKVEVKKPENPQAYDVNFRAKNEKGEISNLVVGHFVLSGQSGSINLVNLDKDSYRKGEVAKLSLFLSGSADNFVGSRRQGSTLDNPSIKIQFKRSDGKKCSADFEKKLILGGDAENVSVPIVEDCFDFYVISQLFDGSQLLDERKMFFDRKSSGVANIETEKDKNSSLTGKEIWVWVLSFLIGLSFLIFILRKFLLKKKIVLLFLVILGSGFILGDSSLVSASTYELKNCYLLSEANASAAHADFEPTLSNCNTSGLSCNSSRCYTDRVAAYNWYKSLWNFGCNSPYFNSEQKSVCKQLANGLVGCPFFTRFGYACATNADLTNPFSSFYDQFRKYGCFCDRARFTFSLDKTEYARGENIKITGNTASVSACDNGITTGIKYNENNVQNQLKWLVGASGPVSFSQEGQTSTQYVKNEPIAMNAPIGVPLFAYFKFSFEHGQNQVLFDDKMDYGGAVGKVWLPYRVLNTCGGSIVANASAYDAEESSMPVPASTNWTYSGSDTATKCQFRCNLGYSWNGSACVASSIPAPTATISQSIAVTTPSTPFTVTWGSTNATSCSVTKSVNGGPVTAWATGISGSQIASPFVIGTHVFTNTCTGSGGTASQSVTHTVANTAPTPTPTPTPAPCIPTCDCYGRCQSYSCTDCSGTCHGNIPAQGGTCGSANGKATCPKPTSNLCGGGSTPSSVTLNGTNNAWVWTCAGICGGTTATCSAKKECPWEETNN